MSVSLSIRIFSLINFSNEIYSIVKKYLPGITSKSKLPSLTVIPPCILFGFLKLLREIVAYSRG